MLKVNILSFFYVFRQIDLKKTELSDQTECQVSSGSALFDIPSAL